MTVNDLVDRFSLRVVAGEKGLGRRVTEGYCGDLLSEIMANATEGCVWLTIQGHQNIVAVAVLRDMAAIIVTGGQTPDDETLQKANQEGIPILLWPKYQVPVVAHNTVTAHSHIEAIKPFSKNLFKGFKIASFLKNPKPTISTIKCVIDDISFSYSFSPRHNQHSKAKNQQNKN